MHRASQARNLDFRCVFITAPRLDLFGRIDHRCEAMMDAGLVEETISLMHAGMMYSC